MGKEDREQDPSGILSGSLNLFGLKIDLGKLLDSPEEIKEQLEELRERLKKAGGKETLGDEEWKGGQVSIGGHFRTSGVLGDREYHIGTVGLATGESRRKREARPPEAIEPPVDIFHEAGEIVVVAEVPGVDMADLELKAEDDVLSLNSKPTARRNYQKRVKLGSPVDPHSLKAQCRNGILEVRFKRRTT